MKYDLTHILAYSTELNVVPGDFNTPYLRGVQIKINDFRWPAHPGGECTNVKQIN